MKLPFLAGCGAVLLVTGCAHLGVGKPAQTEEARPDVRISADVPSLEPAAAGAESSLSPEVLYHYLLAEIAGQRGELALSAKAYLELAKETRDPRLAKRAFEIALYAKRHQEALQAASLWLELEPDSVQARQTVVALLVNLADLKAARPHLERLVQAEGGGHVFLQLNLLLARQEDKDAVLALVQELAQPYRHTPEANFAVAQAAWNANRPESALDAIREALKLRPDWALAAVLQAQILAKSSGNAAALEFLEHYLRSHTQAADVRLHYARVLVGEKRYDQARGEFKRLMTDFPQNPDVALAVGLLSLQLKDYDAAESQLKKTLELGHKEPDSVRVYLGQAAEERKDYEQAKKWYGSVPDGKQYMEANIRYSSVLVKQGSLEQGRQHLAALPAQNLQERVQLIQAEAQLLRESQAYGEAFAFLSRALEKMPDQPDLLYDRAMAAEKLDRLEVLEDDLRKLIHLKPDNAHAYNALGYTFADRNQRLEEAERLVEQALKLAPDDPFILDSMGWVKYRRGDLTQSLNFLKRAYSERPDPEIAAHLGEVLWTSGDRKEAESLWRGSLEQHPENEALQGVVKKYLPQ
jgi:tetratricopeptide (TPR) repeat protein